MTSNNSDQNNSNNKDQNPEDNRPEDNNLENNDLTPEAYYEQIRDQVNEEFDPELNKALRQLRIQANEVVTTWALEGEQRTALKTYAMELGLVDVSPDLIEEYLNAARHSTRKDTHWSSGQPWITNKEFTWIWEGWIVQGFMHVVNALPKLGKTTLLLGLFAELFQKRTGSFLNFSISIEKKYELFIVGPDMNRLLWEKAGIEAGLLTQSAITGQQWQWAEGIKEVWTEEDGVGLTPEFIEELASHAERSVERGAHPIFLLDSYRKLVFNAGDHSEVSSGKYARRLNMLRTAMTAAGERCGVIPTTIVLNHASLSSSKRSASLAAGGDQALMAIPDQCISLNWCSGTDSMVRSDRRVVLTAEGRTGRMVEAQLIEQESAGKWISHGDAGVNEALSKTLEERDRLNGDYAIAFDIVSGRTQNNQTTTRRQVGEIREMQTNGKTTWNHPKIHRLLCYLERRGLVVRAGSTAPGDLGGRPEIVYWTFEREQNTASEPESSSDQGKVRVEEPSQDGVNSQIRVDSGYARAGSDDQHEKQAFDELPEKPKQWTIPCHPIGTEVKYNDGFWDVIGADLATGQHTIQNGQGIIRKGLRKFELNAVIDPNEEL